MKSLRLGYGIAQQGSKLNSLLLNISKMDYWADGLDSDLMSLKTQVGEGGSVKYLPALNMNTVNTYVKTDLDNMIMLDGTAVYEYYLETIFDTIENGNYIISSMALSAIQGWTLTLWKATAYYLHIKDSETIETFMENSGLNTYWNIGLNKIYIKFDLPNKEITLTINDKTMLHTHTRNTVFDIYPGSSITLGSPNLTHKQKPIYFSLKKNGITTYEFMMGDNYGYNDYIFNLIDGSKILRKYNNPSVIFQDYANPYKAGIDLYWHENTLKYTDANPINDNDESLNPKITDENTLVLTDYNLFKRLLPSDIAYHVYDYIELPNKAIFDITNRTYWKVSVESDDYYTGEVGKERWFHKTWLDFDWINTHIEEEYKYKFFVQIRWQKAVGEDYYTKIKIENIVLWNNVPNYYKSRRDIYNNIELGNIYQSRMADGNGAITNGDKKIRYSGNNLQLSLDGGASYDISFDWSTIYPIEKIEHIRIMNNGNILIFSDNKFAHYSDDNLATVNACAIKNLDGTDYVFHTPTNADYPGSYFATLNPLVETDDFIVFGNYSNTYGGAAPINFYYSIDGGITWKVFYTYGQNPKYTDDGTATGGEGGTLLGDPNNTIITTRVESVNLGSDGNVYIGTEGSTINGNYCHSMMKCVYDKPNDAWTVIPLVNSENVGNGRFRANGCWEKDGYIYWSSANTYNLEKGKTDEQSGGIFKCLLEDINDITKHIFLSVPTQVLGYGARSTAFDVESGQAFVSYRKEIHLSNDGGDTWEIFANKYDINMIPTWYDKQNKWWCSGNIVITRFIK